MNMNGTSTSGEDVLEQTRRRISDTLASIRKSASNIADTMQSEILHNTKVLRTVATMLEDGLILLDKDNKITIFNPSASSIFGINADFAVGQKFSEVFPSLARRVLAPGGAIPGQSNVSHTELDQHDFSPGVGRASVSLSATSVDGQDTPVPFSVLVARRTEQSSEHTSQALDNAARDEALEMFNRGLWNFPLPVFSTDVHGNNVKGSREFFELMGIDPLTVTGRGVDEILPSECLSWYYKEEQKSKMHFSVHTTRGVIDMEAHKSLIVASPKAGGVRGFVTCLVRQPVLTTEITFASSFIKALDALDRPMMMVSFSEGRILLVNKAFCTKYQYDRTGITNRSVQTLLASTFDSLRRSFIVSLANGEEPVGSFDVVDAAGVTSRHTVKAIAISPEGSAGNLPKYCLLSEC